MKRPTVLCASLLLTFVAVRAYLHAWPETDLDVAGYNVHHLFTGLLLVALGGIAAMLLPVEHRYSLPAVAVFGVGLSLALDEWLYLIVTDGTNASYLLPVSFWGGAGAISLAVAYAAVLGRAAKGTRSTSSRQG